MAEALTYLRVIGSTALQGLFTAAWVSARELPAAKRRAARAGATVVAAAVGWVTEPDDEQPDPENAERADPDQPIAVRSVAVTLASIGLGVGVVVGVRVLEKRWLAGLQRNGHAHPYRALGLRMGLLTVAGSLPARLLEAKRKAG